jgi:rhodanese-related sulfurtransferase
MTTQKFISMHELHERLLTEPVSISSEDIIVDVRTPEEFKDGHIAGALNRPLDQIQQSPETFKNEFQKYRDVYVHCQAGRRDPPGLRARRRRQREHPGRPHRSRGA